eukprot:TRINITY_DN10008_c0_g1_i1.p1 TRINITY_DN10008_c0_g1~~TRINITY_DN10008_c0_g1_i1.p1  ORF type:complete len:142 (+),score=24.31 TRINITY_DN10008_c0_g1_i1:61-426(+)
MCIRDRYLRDKFKLLKWYAFFGVIIVALAEVLFIFLNPWIAISFLTLGECLRACFIWIFLSEVVPLDLIGDGTGILYAVKNALYAISPYINLIIRMITNRWRDIPYIYSCLLYTSPSPRDS